MFYQLLLLLFEYSIKNNLYHDTMQHTAALHNTTFKDKIMSI